MLELMNIDLLRAVVPRLALVHVKHCIKLFLSYQMFSKALRSLRLHLCHRKNPKNIFVNNVKLDDNNASYSINRDLGSSS